MKVLIADDDPHVRSAIQLVLAQEPGISIVADCSTADCLVEQVVSLGADILIVDWELPGFRAAPAIYRLLNAGCQVVALSGHPEEHDAALRAGAIKFVCKCDTPETLLEIIRTLASKR